MSLVRLLAAVLLLAQSGGVSRILCVSPTGHEAIEDSMALCCARETGTPEGALSQPTPCEGCTDYAVTPTIEITSQPAPSTSPVIAAAAIPLSVGFPFGTPAFQGVVSVQEQAGFADSPPLTTSLRC